MAVWELSRTCPTGLLILEGIQHLSLLGFLGSRACSLQGMCYSEGALMLAALLEASWAYAVGQEEEQRG